MADRLLYVNQAPIPLDRLLSRQVPPRRRIIKVTFKSQTKYNVSTTRLTNGLPKVSQTVGTLPLCGIRGMTTNLPNNIGYPSFSSHRLG